MSKRTFPMPLFLLASPADIHLLIYLHTGGSISVPSVPAKTDFQQCTPGTLDNEPASQAISEDAQHQNSVLSVPGVPNTIPPSYSVKFSGNLYNFRRGTE